MENKYLKERSFRIGRAFLCLLVLALASLFANTGCWRANEHYFDTNKINKAIECELAELKKSSGRGEGFLSAEFSCLDLIKEYCLRKEVEEYLGIKFGEAEEIVLIEAVAANINIEYTAWVIVAKEDSVHLCKSKMEFDFRLANNKRSSKSTIKYQDWLRFQDKHRIDFKSLKSTGSGLVPLDDGLCFFVTSIKGRDCIVRTCYAPYVYEAVGADEYSEPSLDNISVYWNAVKRALSFVDENVEPKWITRF